MKGEIIAIGGGRMSSEETLFIDSYIVSRVNKKNPRALFIPTASKDNIGYCESFKNIYGNLLNCKIDYLLLCSDIKYQTQQIKKIIKEKIDWADLIYVSGGNTLYMMKVWRKFRVDKELKRAYNEGKILAGVSAGAVCWYRGGYSDSYRNKYIIVKGLGLINAYQVPHFNHKKVKINFLNSLLKKRRETVWYALEDNTALVNNLDGLTLIKSNFLANAYKFEKQKNGKYKKEKIKMNNL